MSYELTVADLLRPLMKRMAATEVLATVANPFEGEIVVSMLESAGIASDLRSPSAVGFFFEPMGGVGAGPVDVLVPREQLAEATELLAQSQKGNDTQ